MLFSQPVRLINKQDGVTLLEVLVVTAAIGFMVLIIASVPTSVYLINQSRSTSLARDIISQKIDALRKQGYGNLANGKTPFTDPAMSKLHQVVAYYQIEDCPINICDVGLKVKQLIVHIDWQEKDSTKSAKVSTLVSEGGIGQ